VSRGCGWQHLAALTNLVAYYFVAMPLALLFAFKLKFYAKVSINQSVGPVICGGQHQHVLARRSCNCKPASLQLLTLSEL
jgi:hypothetical protein